MATSLLFWNVMGNDAASWPRREPNLRRHFGRLAANADLLMLAESRFIPADLASSLGAGWNAVASRTRRVQVYSRLTDGAVVEVRADREVDRWTMLQVDAPGAPEWLLVVTHLQGRPHWTSADQQAQATVFASSIAVVEDMLGHQRTIVIGDLNTDPFDPGMIAANGLNAVMARDLAVPEGRIVAGRTYRSFYNPMWSLLGDRTPGPPGTFFHSSGAHLECHWHALDQVLLRPDLADSLSDLRILDTDGTEALVTERGRPASSRASDHLPIQAWLLC